MYSALQKMIDHFGRPTEHEIFDVEHRHQYASDGYHANEWVAFQMGEAKSESQTFSLFHGTSALSAIKIDCDGFFVYDTSIHGGKTGIFGQALLTDALLYAKRKPPTSVVENDEFLSWEQCPVVIEYACDPDQEHVYHKER